MKQHILSLTMLALAASPLHADPPAPPMDSGQEEMHAQHQVSTCCRDLEQQLLTPTRYALAYVEADDKMVVAPDMGVVQHTQEATTEAGVGLFDSYTQETLQPAPISNTPPTVLLAGCCDQGYGTGRYWFAVLAALSMAALAWFHFRPRQPA